MTICTSGSRVVVLFLLLLRLIYLRDKTRGCCIAASNRSFVEFIVFLHFGSVFQRDKKKIPPKHEAEISDGFVFPFSRFEFLIHLNNAS